MARDEMVRDEMVRDEMVRDEMVRDGSNLSAQVGASVRACRYHRKDLKVVDRCLAAGRLPLGLGLLLVAASTHCLALPPHRQAVTLQALVCASTCSSWILCSHTRHSTVLCRLRSEHPVASSLDMHLLHPVASSATCTSCTPAH